MFLFELIAVWLLMKGRHPGARVLIATTWSGGEGGEGLRGGEGGRLLSESANQTCNWEMVGVGRAVRVQRRRGSRVGGRVQVPRVAWPLDSPCAPQHAPVPVWSPRTPHSLSHAERASENSKGRKALGNIPEVFKGKYTLWCFKQSLNFSD